MGAFAVVGRGWVVGLAAQTERSGEQRPGGRDLMLVVIR